MRCRKKVMLKWILFLKKEKKEKAADKGRVETCVLADFSRESSIIERASIVPLSSSRCHCDTPCLISRRRDTIHASTSAPGGDQKKSERSTASLCTDKSRRLSLFFAVAALQFPHLLSATWTNTETTDVSMGVGGPTHV